jgi:hypothetical protein
VEAAVASGSSVLPHTLPPRTEKEARQAAVYRIVYAFLNECTVVDSTPGVFLDLDSRQGPDGFAKPGLREELALWCSAQGIEAPQLKGRGWVRALPHGVEFKSDFKARQVRGIAWPLEGEVRRVSLSWSWHLFEAAAVLLHCAWAFAIPIIVSTHAMVLQDAWGNLLCLPGFEGSGTRPLVWVMATSLSAGGDAVTPDEHYHQLSGEATLSTDASEHAPHLPTTYVVPLVSLLLIESACFTGASIVRLLWLYLNPPSTQPWRLLTGVMQHGFMLVCVVHLALVFAYVGVFMSWLVLAAALEPTRFLPYGIAVVALVLVGLVVGKGPSLAWPPPPPLPRTMRMRLRASDARALLTAVCAGRVLLQR